MIEAVALGIVQGIAEWLPISSEGMLVLARTALFGSREGLSVLIEQALFLHAGTFLAALLYLRKEVTGLIGALVFPARAKPAVRRLLGFLAISTAVSGAVGLWLIRAISGAEPLLHLTGRWITAGVGGLLIVTGRIQRASKTGGTRTPASFGWKDGVLLGLVQGLTVLPGLSRSGLTISALLLRKVEEETALRVSFLMSLPVVLGANLILNRDAAWGPEAWAGLAAACAVGLATLHTLILWARRVRFDRFLIGFGGLTLLAALLQHA